MEKVWGALRLPEDNNWDFGVKEGFLKEVIHKRRFEESGGICLMKGKHASRTDVGQHSTGWARSGLGWGGLTKTLQFCRSFSPWLQCRVTERFHTRQRYITKLSFRKIAFATLCRMEWREAGLRTGRPEKAFMVIWQRWVPQKPQILNIHNWTKAYYVFHNSLLLGIMLHSLCHSIRNLGVFCNDYISHPFRFSVLHILPPSYLSNL